MTTLQRRQRGSNKFGKGVIRVPQRGGKPDKFGARAGPQQRSVGSFATPEVDISARRDGDRWIIAVSDNGIGLDIKFAEKIFAPFQRLHSHEAYPGTGIGLAMVRQAVERHGGEIWVKSAPGSGATFYFTLPADRSMPAPEPVGLDNAAK